MQTAWEEGTLVLQRLPSSGGQRAEQVQDVALLIPGRCHGCCNATLIQGRSAVETGQSHQRQTGAPAHASPTNARPPDEDFDFAPTPRLPPTWMSLWEGHHEAIVAGRRSADETSKLCGAELNVTAIYYVPLMFVVYFMMCCSVYISREKKYERYTTFGLVRHNIFIVIHVNWSPKTLHKSVG